MFVFSKLFSAITQPLFWIVIWWFLALILPPRFRQTATSMLWAGLLFLVLLGFSVVPNSLLRLLESRFNVPSEIQSDQFIGVIVLGGAIGKPSIYKAHNQVPLGDAAERMTAPIALIRQFPKLELLFSGGDGRLVPTGTSEAEIARTFFWEQGLDMQRLTLESKSRTTRENARRVAELLGERCKQPWLLVTSAWHMPRSMAEFQAVGCNVTAYPVDFRTGEETSWTEYSLANSLMAWQIALHELLGIFVYKLTR
jgi:uncharacterized SAM-binding protein YcdF (DUF218 family)